MFICADSLYQLCETSNSALSFSIGLKPHTTARVLEEEGMKVPQFGVHKFIQHYSECGSTDRKAGSGWLSKVTTQVKQLVDQQMEKDDAITAYIPALSRAYCKLNSNYFYYVVTHL